MGVSYHEKDVAAGGGLYVTYCMACHGVPAINNGGGVPNLGYSHPDTIRNAKSLVLTGALMEKGMPNFKGKVTEREVEQIVAFIQGTADAVRAAAEKTQSQE